MGLIVWLDAEDCDPPHGLDMESEHDLYKVIDLGNDFLIYGGFDCSKSALVGYVKAGRVQLLSGTHRHMAALNTDTKLPVVLWLGSDIEKAWGDLEKWRKVIEDIPVSTLETWTREDLERVRCV